MYRYRVFTKASLIIVMLTCYCLAIFHTQFYKQPKIETIPIRITANKAIVPNKYVLKGSVFTFPVRGTWVIEIEDGFTSFFIYQGDYSILNYRACNEPDRAIYIAHDVFAGKIYTGHPNECGLKLLLQPLIVEELAAFTLNPGTVDKKISTRIGEYNLRGDENGLIITSIDGEIVYSQKKISNNKWELNWIEEKKKASIEVISIKAYPTS